MALPDVNLWTSPEHALDYLQRADSIPHRTEGEAELLECLPHRLTRFLDLGTGDGRLLHLVKLARPQASAVALDFSPMMLERARARFANRREIEIYEHDLQDSLPQLGRFDAVVSSFAIHHLTHPRKRQLYQEIFGLINPGGVFCNLEHVASPTDSLHRRFLQKIGYEKDEDPSNKLLDLHRQLVWLGEIGFQDVDCLWKWRELALMVGRR